MSTKENPIISYFKKSYEELEKVTWMTKKQMLISSALVIGISIFVTVFIALIDYLLSRGYVELLNKMTVN